MERQPTPFSFSHIHINIYTRIERRTFTHFPSTLSESCLAVDTPHCSQVCRRSVAIPPSARSSPSSIKPPRIGGASEARAPRTVSRWLALVTNASAWLSVFFFPSFFLIPSSLFLSIYLYFYLFLFLIRIFPSLLFFPFHFFSLSFSSNHREKGCSRHISYRTTLGRPVRVDRSRPFLFFFLFSFHYSLPFLILFFSFLCHYYFVNYFFFFLTKLRGKSILRRERTSSCRTK